MPRGHDGGGPCPESSSRRRHPAEPGFGLTVISQPPLPHPPDVTMPMALDADHPLVDGRMAGSPLIAACRGHGPTRRPIWFMRQAGRSLPEYRALRDGVGMLESCLDPALAAEITLQPVRRHDVDAGIFFSDIVVPLRLAGVDVDIVPGVGPVLGSPIR